MSQKMQSPFPGRSLTGAVKNHKTLSGNIVTVQIDGQPVGRALNVRYDEDFGTEPIYEVGSMLPAELIPQRWSCRLSIEKYALRERAFDGLNVAYSEDILLKNLFDLIVKDRTTGKIIHLFRGCVQANAGGQIAANRPVNQNATFYAMDHLSGDELDQETTEVR